MFSALTAVKFAVSGVVGLGTGKIVSGIIKNNVTPKNIIDKVAIISATWVVSGVVTKATKSYTNEMIDETYTGIKEVVDKFKLDGKLGRINRNESTFETEGLDPNLFHKDANGQWVPINVSDDEQGLVYNPN